MLLMEGLTGNSSCEVCNCDSFKYKCPKCLKRTCSLKCSKEHKNIDQCSGMANEPTEYVSSDALKQANTKDEMNKIVQRDYNFLNNVGRYIQVLKQDGQKITGKNFRQAVPNQVGKPQRIIRRGVKCLLLPKGMQRSLSNKSKWDKPLDTFVWSIEWVLVKDGNEAEKLTHLSHRNQEQLPLVECIGKSIFEKCMEWFGNPSALEAVGEHMVKEDRSRLLLESDIKFYTKWFPVDLETFSDSKRVVEIDPRRCIGELLKEKTVIEFPTIYVTTSKEALSKLGLTVVEENYNRDSSSSSCSDSESDTSSSEDSDDSSDSDEAPEELPVNAVPEVHTEDRSDESGDDYTPGISLDFLAD
ncbi:HBR301Cp [Eremothecium sinecaudum]|uniref:HBR301Cp n=1 Tax=Eremothecium sinecaudum TaxID=45286 RepID=A0A120K1B5_9SACH|nr:HBR301Cp [Eremothecium sinecaudum]AMD19202.1 HBR301Cp [Eremothecium sinecaudum]